MLVHHWSHPTTPAGPGWDTVISGRVQLVTETGFSARAALGEADVIRVIVDDPNGEYDFKTLHRWYMVETGCPANNQLVWNGYIGDQRISRGREGLFPTGSGRQWELELVQENTILGFRIVTGADGNRPAETAKARLTWLLGSDYLSTVKDHGLIDWTGLATFAMDPVDYRGQTAADILRDISLVSGYNHYARYHEPSGDIELACYDPNTSALDPSSLRVSSDPADIDLAITWPAAMDTELTRQGSRVAAGIYVPFNGGAAYKYDYTTSYTYGFRDAAAPSANVKTLTAANALADRLLAQHASQDERITTRLQLPSAALNDVKHGQLIHVRSTWAPGWSSFRAARVVSRSFSRPPNLTQAAYDVDLELSPQPSASGAFGSSFTGSNPATPILPRATTPGNLLVLIAAAAPINALGIDYLFAPSLVPGTGGSSEPWTVGAAFTKAYDELQYGGAGATVGVGIWWRRVSADETTTTPVIVAPASGNVASAWLYEFEAAASPSGGVTYTSEPGYVANGGTATMPSLSGDLVLGAFVVQQASYEYAPVVTPVTGTTVTNADGHNIAFATNSGTDWQVPWTWIGTLRGGGALAASVTYDPHGGGSVVNHYGIAGAAIALPLVPVPTIPNPPNQVTT